LEAANQSGTKIRKAVKIYERERERDERNAHLSYLYIRAGGIFRAV
jgi:hypothetical protein